jgi:uncharacterized paraquat-inducible protein A
MQTGSTSCTECGAVIPGDRSSCPRCHLPRWYTLKKVSLCVVVVVVLAILVRYAVQFGERTLSLWFGYV